MNVRAAIWDTLELASERRNFANAMVEHPSLGWEHLRDMWAVIDGDQSEPMSDTKLCRWLGWIQAAVVSWDVATLEDMKDISRTHTDD